MRNYGEVSARGAVGAAAALFPILECARVEGEAARSCREILGGAYAYDGSHRAGR